MSIIAFFTNEVHLKVIFKTHLEGNHFQTLKGSVKDIFAVALGCGGGGSKKFSLGREAKRG
jgi:hypothetical protein